MDPEVEDPGEEVLHEMERAEEASKPRSSLGSEGVKAFVNRRVRGKQPCPAWFEATGFPKTTVSATSPGEQAVAAEAWHSLGTSIGCTHALRTPWTGSQKASHGLDF